MPHCFYKCELLDSIGFPEGMLDIGEEGYPEGFSDVFTSDREVSPEVGKVQIYVPSMYLNLYAELLPTDYEKYYELLPCPDLFAVFNMECFKVEEGETNLPAMI